MVVTVIILSLAAGILLLDKMAVGEFGVSQPIILCPLIGLFFNNFPVGLFLGCVLQLIWLGSLPLGSKEPLDNQGAGAVAICNYILGKKVLPELSQEQLVFIVLLLAGFASIFGQILSQITKKINNNIFNYLNIRSSYRVIILANFLGIIIYLLRGFILVIIFQSILLLIMMTPFPTRLPQFTFFELLVFPLAIGIASIADIIILKRRFFYTIIGILLGNLLWIVVK
ncbi:MAG: PTS sugar transporter subunit IIC [candidate division WOR-3 bacterium]|nr:PTS sugar transporter subunit IIC [candidate division WOR-3 bacterium]